MHLISLLRFLYEIGISPPRRSCSRDQVLSNCLLPPASRDDSLIATQTSPGLDLPTERIATRLKKKCSYERDEDATNERNVWLERFKWNVGSQLSFKTYWIPIDTFLQCVPGSGQAGSPRPHSFSHSVAYGASDVTIKEYLFDCFFNIIPQDLRWYNDDDRFNDDRASLLKYGCIS